MSIFSPSWNFISKRSGLQSTSSVGPDLELSGVGQNVNHSNPLMGLIEAETKP